MHTSIHVQTYCISFLRSKVEQARTMFNVAATRISSQIKSTYINPFDGTGLSPIQPAIDLVLIFFLGSRKITAGYILTEAMVEQVIS